MPHKTLHGTISIYDQPDQNIQAGSCFRGDMTVHHIKAPIKVQTSADLQGNRDRPEKPTVESIIKCCLDQRATPREYSEQEWRQQLPQWRFNCAKLMVLQKDLDSCLPKHHHAATPACLDGPMKYATQQPTNSCRQQAPANRGLRLDLRPGGHESATSNAKTMTKAHIRHLTTLPSGPASSNQLPEERHH